MCWKVVSLIAALVDEVSAENNELTHEAKRKWVERLVGRSRVYSGLWPQSSIPPIKSTNSSPHCLSLLLSTYPFLSIRSVELRHNNGIYFFIESRIVIAYSIIGIGMIRSAICLVSTTRTTVLISRVQIYPTALI